MEGIPLANSRHTDVAREFTTFDAIFTLLVFLSIILVNLSLYRFCRRDIAPHMEDAEDTATPRQSEEIDLEKAEVLEWTPMLADEEREKSYGSTLNWSMVPGNGF